MDCYWSYCGFQSKQDLYCWHVMLNYFLLDKTVDFFVNVLLVCHTLRGTMDNYQLIDCRIQDGVF